MNERTWEDVIKFDSKLTIGRHCVNMRHSNGSVRIVIVEITNKGSVYLLAKPGPEDKYTSWSRIKGDCLESLPKAKITVWAHKIPEFMAMFENPITCISK